MKLQSKLFVLVGVNPANDCTEFVKSVANMEGGVQFTKNLDDSIHSFDRNVVELTREMYKNPSLVIETHNFVGKIVPETAMRYQLEVVNAETLVQISEPFKWIQCIKLGSNFGIKFITSSSPTYFTKEAVDNILMHHDEPFEDGTTIVARIA